ncbi:MAG TPA: sterol carrier protein domain-containing protein [Actinomycetes bacterium]|nr:sterol carrier protein domain-containing protein [Actinomycetes bacterium]
MSRSPARWALDLRDPAWRREPSQPRRYDVVYEPAPGRADGYATYRVTAGWSSGLPHGSVQVDELVALCPEATVALYRYCLQLDLATTVAFLRRSPEEPLRWLLADPRRLRATAVGDRLWLRLLDVPAALAARRYAVQGTLIIGVTDQLRPANQGTVRLEGGPDSAACRLTRGQSDLACDVADLGAAYLGGVSFSMLARAGRVVEHKRGAVARADAMFVLQPAPWCSTVF